MADTKQTAFKLNLNDKRLLAELTRYHKLDNNSETLRKLIRDAAGAASIPLEDDMQKELILHTEDSTNCSSMPRTKFKLLSLAFLASSIKVKFDKHPIDVIGWSLFDGGQPYPVSIVRAEDVNGKEGYLLWGSSGGIRILDSNREPMPGKNDDSLRGYGLPMLWIDNEAKLPPEIVEKLLEN